MRKMMLTVLACVAFAVGAHAQIYSFEKSQTEDWKAKNATLSRSAERFKLGKASLRIDWQGGAVVRMDNPMGLEKASKSSNGGVTLWIYNERAVAEPLRIVFFDAAGQEACAMDCGLNFEGWRCVWNKFREDMGKGSKTPLFAAELQFPAVAQGGVSYLDCMEFSPNVSWQKMTDAQVKVHRTDFSLIPDFMKYRNAEPDASKAIEASAEQIEQIGERLERWYLGSDNASGEWVEHRRSREAEFIRGGVKTASKYTLTEPLYHLRTPASIDGEPTIYFMDINKFVLLPLALDYRKNGNTASLDRALKIYDWFYDQGWADGSALGSLCFEKLRSAGYFHSLYLLRDRLPADVLTRELNALRWFTMFGICYLEPEHPGEVADNLRALALPKLVYALSLPGERDRQVALTAFRDYMDNALGFGPGYFGTFKSDFSGYHHRGAYNSAYYPHALYVGALVAYLLHDTPYALSATTLHNLKQGLLTFRFFCAGLHVPAGTVGRFPQNQEILQELLPAFAYTAFASKEPDQELLAVAKRLMRDYPAQVERVIDDVNSDLSYTTTVGEAELMEAVRKSSVEPEQAPIGALFMPYSGLLVVKNADYHFNVKGFSKYIWDFESSATENLAGRYLSNGQIEYFDLRKDHKSFNPKSEAFDWSLIPGTTSIRLPYETLAKKKHAKGFDDHRNYSDESFLAGVVADEKTALFSFRMHDRAYSPGLKANKSVFFFDDVLLCMGSDITSKDAAHSTVTTLFQSPGDASTPKLRRTTGGSLVADHAGIVYAVVGGDPTLDARAPFTRAYIDHGCSPSKASYRYFMLPGGDSKRAAQLLSKRSPVEVLRQDDGAHIVRRDNGMVFAALYDAGASYAGLPVSRVNIPLAYIFRPQAGGCFSLTLCEPDMRRPSVDHMGQLTEEQVVTPETPFTTRLWVSGLYDVRSSGADVRTSYTDSETVIELTTVCGKNYTLELSAR